MEINCSIIIPVYNTWPLAERLFESIPAREDVEVIVVDDCSTKFLDVKETLKAQYAYYIWDKTEKNVGGGGARNKGLKHAAGKWVVFADSDDMFTEHFNKCLDKYKDTDYDIVFFNIKALDVRGNEYKHRISYVITETLKDVDIFNIKYRLTQPWAKFVKRGLIQEHDVRFEETPINNDVMFSTLCDFYAEKIAIDPTCLYVYQRHHNSTQGDMNVEKALIKHEVICKRNKFLRSKGIMPREYRNFVNINIIYILKHGTTKDKFRMLKTALKYDFPKALLAFLDSSHSILKESF